MCLDPVLWLISWSSHNSLSPNRPLPLQSSFISLWQYMFSFFPNRWGYLVHELSLSAWQLWDLSFQKNAGGPEAGFGVQWNGPRATVFAVMWSMSQDWQWQTHILAEECWQQECVTSPSPSDTHPLGASWFILASQLMWQVGKINKYNNIL